MKVIKKDGRIQSFDISKVRSSILGASIDSNTIINESDLKIVSNRVVKVLNSIREEKGLEKLQSNVTGITSTYEIFAVIIDSLNKYRFKDIASAYLGYKEKCCK